MRQKRNRNYGMIKRVGMLSVFLIPAVVIILGASISNSSADNKGHHKRPFKDAEFFIEFNSTAGDTGVQVFLDDDNWRWITISDPDHQRIFKVKGISTLGRQGLTELFFESVEPELADLPVVEFLERFPEGDYKFKGFRNDMTVLRSYVEFTHVIPCGPEVLPEDGAVLDPTSEIVISWEDVEMVVDPAETDATEEMVCIEPEQLEQDLEIDIYQVIVENDDIHLIVDLTADDRSLTVPPELLEDNTLYIFEVLAKEDSGNQTITEGFFCTGPSLVYDECVELFEAH